MLLDRQPDPRDGAGGAIVNLAEWSDDTYIVDAWAGALGNDVFYRVSDSMPARLRTTYSQRITQQYDSNNEG